MLFLYLDESGNYVFSRKGSEFLIYTALATDNPYKLQYCLCEAEKKLRSEQVLPDDFDCFHATEDRQVVRDAVYDVLKESDSFTIDSIIVEKCKAYPHLHDETRLYKKIYHYLLDYVFKRYSDVEKIMIFIDAPPVKKKRHAFEKGIKETLSDILDKDRLGKEIRYYIQYMPSFSSYGLQAVDYCCWAFKKKWGDWGQKIDPRPYNCISEKVKSEFEIFRMGNQSFY